MDRNTDVRRGQPMANGFSRRRPQRSGVGGMRDSPEEGVAGELPESAAVRLRDRKKDRLSRSKRRRGERLHGNREEGGDESSEESVDIDDDDDEEEEDASAPNHRRCIPPTAAKIVKPPWKVSDEMIGVPVPRKARSASVKRSHEGSVSGGGDQIPVLRQCSTSPATPTAASVSPPSSNASIRRRVKPIGAKQRSAKVSKVSIQEEIEIEVAEVLYGLRQYPAPAVNPELSGSASYPKIEAKEEESPALVGKPRVSSPISPQQSAAGPKVWNSTTALSPPVAASKRKRPRPVKPEEERSGFGSVTVSSLSTAPVSCVGKAEVEKVEVSSPRADNSITGVVGARSVKLEINQESKKPHLISETSPASAVGATDATVVPDVICRDKTEPKEEVSGVVKPDVDLEDSVQGVSSSPATCDVPEEKFKIDLMAPPTKSMLDGDINRDSILQMETTNVKEDVEMIEMKETKALKVEEKVPSKDFEPEKQTEVTQGCEPAKQSKEQTLDLRVDVEKSEKDGSKQQGQKHAKVTKTDARSSEVSNQPEKSVPSSSGPSPTMTGPSSLPLSMTVAGWPGGLSHLGYIGQAPPSWPGAPSIQAVVPMESNTGAPTFQPHFLLPQQRYKRCGTHCHIAQMINYLQHVARMNPFWAAASNPSLFGAKPYNLNSMPSTEGMILGSPLPGSFSAANFTATGRVPGLMQEKSSGNAITFGGHAPKEKASGPFADGQRKQQPAVQQPTLPVSATSIPHGPAIIFPLNQVTAAVRPGGSKAPIAGNAAAPSAAQIGGAVASGAAATVSYSFASLPANEAQYIAMVQSSGYPFQIPAHVGAAASAYRGSTAHLGQASAAAAAAAAPPPQFFNGSFYASHILHPSQVQQVQSQALQQGQQNPSTSSGSSSSQKHPQQHRMQGGGGSSSHKYQQQQQEQHQQRTQQQSLATSLHPHHHSNGPPSQPRQSEAAAAESDAATIADNKVSSAQKNLYNRNNHHHQTLNPSYSINSLPVPVHHAQNFAIMSALGSGKDGEKQHLQPQSSDSHIQCGLKGVELTPSQTFAMSFAPGIDFSLAQGHHAVFQNLPEPLRQNYQLAAQAAVVAAAAQQQHVQRTSNQKIGEDGKNIGDHAGGSAGQEERKSGSAKAAPAVASHTLTFARQPESSNENASISIFNSSSTHASSPAILDNPSRGLNLLSVPLNLVSLPANGARITCPTSASTTNAQPQQQSQLMVRSKPATTSNASIPTVPVQTAAAVSYADRLPANKFPGGLSAFPQALIQGTTTQSPQWKPAPAGVPSTRTTSSTSAPSPPKQSKNPAVIGSGSSAVHSQISFVNSGVNAKTTTMPIGHVAHVLPNSSFNNNVSIAAPARQNSSTPIIGPPASITKSSGSPSSRAPAGTKGGVLSAPVAAATQQQKNPHTSSSRKPSPPPGGRSNLPSILGHPQLVQSLSSKQPQQQQQPQLQSSTLKNQHQSQQHHQKQQLQHAQILFANSYIPTQSSQPPSLTAAAAAGYYPKQSSLQPSMSNLPQRRPSSEQPQKNSPSASSNFIATGALSLGPPTLSLASSASDASKSSGANNAALKGSTGILQTHQFSTPLSTATHPSNPNAAAVVAAAFPYLHAVSTVPMKSAEQNSAGAKQKQEKIQ